MSASTLSIDGAPVVRLSPPHLNDMNLHQRRTCLRPLRIDGPRWEVEPLNSGIVVHNYGHGPAGWTLAPGSGRHVVELLRRHIMQATLSPLALDAPVAVVGAGVIGLFTARALLATGYHNITVYAAEIDDLTSHRAGGFLAPAGITAHPTVQPNLQRIALDSYDQWKLIATAHTGQTVHSAVYPYAAYVHRYPLEADVHGLKCYADSGRLTVRDVVVDFGHVRREMQVYEGGVFMNTGRLMRELLTDVRLRGVSVLQRHVQTLDSLHVDHPVVFNCCGHSAASLVHDSHSIGALGHTISLRHQPATTSPPYSVSMYGADTTEHGIRIKRAVYLHPRSGDGGGAGEVGLLGGTVVQGVDEGEWGVERNEREWCGVVQRAREFFYGDRVEEWSGFVHEEQGGTLRSLL